VFARDIATISNLEELLSDISTIESIRRRIQQGDIYLAKAVIKPKIILQLIDYLTQIGRSSLPNYHALEFGCPNHHRINREDPRSYVGGCFHQFSFFPWNQDLFGLFALFEPVFRLKNLLNGCEPRKFLSPVPEEGCTARIAFQFYPRGQGRLNRHQDPVDYHQLTVPLLLMTDRGKDFEVGGGYFEQENGKKLRIEDFAGIGDVVFANAQIPHGVDLVDPGSDSNWLEFLGRWVAIFPANKLAGNDRIANAFDLDK
jgi:hypothetical protein